MLNSPQICKDYGIKGLSKSLQDYNIARNLLDEIDSKTDNAITPPLKGKEGKYITYFAIGFCDRKLAEFLETYFHELYHQTGWSHADEPPNKAKEFGKKLSSLMGNTQALQAFKEKYKLK